MTAKDQDGRTEFIQAAVGGDLPYAETLAEYMATNVNSHYVHGMTATYWAAVSEQPKMLLDSGSNEEGTEDNERTAVEMMEAFQIR